MKVVGPGACRDTTVMRRVPVQEFRAVHVLRLRVAGGQSRTYWSWGSPKKSPVIHLGGAKGSDGDGNLMINPSLRDLAQRAGDLARVPGRTGRPRHRRRRAGGSRGGGVRGVGRRLDGRDGPPRAGRTGRRFVEDRKLHRLPQRAVRGWNSRRAACCNAQVRREDGRPGRGRPASSRRPGRTTDFNEDEYHVLHLDCGAKSRPRSCSSPPACAWRKLEAEGAERYESAGVYYACTAVEALLHDGDDVVVVGGGQLRRAGGDVPRGVLPLAEGSPPRPQHARAVHVRLPRRPHPRDAEHQGSRRRGDLGGRAADDGSRRSTEPSARAADADVRNAPPVEQLGSRRDLRVHRRRAAAPMAARARSRATTSVTS